MTAIMQPNDRTIDKRNNEIFKGPFDDDVLSPGTRHRLFSAIELLAANRLDDSFRCCTVDRSHQRRALPKRLDLPGQRRSHPASLSV
ncbi:hypothetical protein HMPREF9621_01861 [Cutibacterium modestum HL037PA2]|nr:hypothetical protein HMPREF9621_01861 [Cutibacterium modestum HL037PA2]